MFHLGDISELKEIHQSENSIVWSGVDNHTKRKVAIKMLNNEFPSTNMIARFNEEAELSQRFDIKGVRKIWEKRKIDNRHALVMEYVEGVPLYELIRKNDISIARFLRLAINITHILSEIHKNGIVHKDVNPRNLLVSPYEIVHVIDFGIASLAKKETQKMEAPERLEGTLAYISPEQTGRMNHSIDSRSDLYSLGVTFYEMLTGTLPFEATNAMELVHSHIAKIPDSPQTRKTQIPKILSDIVLKLIAKNIHDRYQTALSLKHDLDRCWEVLNMQGIEELQRLEFELGRQEYNVNFRIPEKLYGREQERAVLLNAFAQAEAGGTECLLVGGHSGIGKTALIRELYRPVTEKRSYFLAGKFDQFQRDVPYSAIIMALNGFVQQLLGESDKRLGHWQREMMEALEDNAGVLTEIVPNLELILGKQPEPASLPPLESQNRFNRVFQKFFKDLSTSKHALVIFIDDWQWADNSSLHLLKQLMSDTSVKHLLFVAAYRTNEVDMVHPFMSTVNEMHLSKAPLQEIFLGELEAGHIAEMLRDTFSATTEEVEPLAKLIKAKTSGNPFFISQFLQNLYEGGHIAYNYEAHAWRWNLELIQDLPISHNVLELMTVRIKTLQPKTQGLLQLAACIGNNFSLKLLAELYHKTQLETRQDILEALEQGFVLPSQGNHYAIDEEETDKGVYFQFLHDRVQQAAYLMAEESQREVLSLKIGRIVYANNSEEHRQQLMCDIANYYNKGRRLIISRQEKELLAEVNLKASIKSKKITAYGASLVYAKTGVELLGEYLWDITFDLAYELHKQMADSLYLNGEKEEAERLFRELIEKAPSRLQKIQIYGMKILLYESSSRYHEAIETARESLALLNLVLPETEEEKASLFEVEVEVISRILQEKGIEHILDLPALQNQELKEAMLILYIAWSSCYMAGDMNLVLLTSALGVRISLVDGNTPESGWAYIAYATFVSSGFQDYQAGYKLGEMAIKVNELHPDQKTKGTIYHLMGIFIHHWCKHIREGFRYFLTAFDACVQSGSYGYAGYAHAVLVRHEVLAGVPLDEIATQHDQRMLVQYSIGNFIIAQLGLVVNAYVKNMLGKSAGVYSFDNEEFYEEPYIDNFQSLPIFRGIYHPLKARMYLYHEQYELALEQCELANPLMISLFGAEWNWFHNVNYSLALCGILREHYLDNNPEKREALLEQVGKNQTKLKLWVDNCPDNFLHHYLTIEAELANIHGDFMQAMNLYDEAIRQAQKQDFVHDEALACELLGKFYLRHRKDEFARIYIQKAFYAYNLWGAESMLKRLREKYKQMFALIRRNSQPNNPFQARNVVRTTQSPHSVPSTTYNENSLDLMTVMKASQAISQEIKLDLLVQNMVSVLMENAGAERAVLIQEQKNDLYIAAEAHLHTNVVTLLSETPLKNTDKDRIALTVIRQCYRKQESFVSNHAKRDHRFVMDTYIQQNDVKSLLCLPVVHHGKVRLVIYMEHNQIEGAFTNERVEVLNMLSSQVAISIENAMLYETVEQKVEERTRELANKTQELATANEELGLKNESITSSIKYALRMQQAILPADEDLRKLSPDFFVLYLPKDIVSGDFYWYTQLFNKHMIAVIDCTGHGVPGAFMSMIANTLLDEIVNQKEIDDLTEILEQLHKGVRIALNQEVSHNTDGMDMGLCVLEALPTGETEIMFVGAKVFLAYVQAGKFGTLQADRRSIGGDSTRQATSFQAQSLTLREGDVFYLTTDGYTDQAGGANRLAFTKKRYTDLIKEHWQKSMAEQRDVFLQTLLQYQANIPQRDDITLVGFRVSM